MTVSPLPVVFEPIFKPKPWGGRRLATLLGKRLPGDGPIGESWELSDLPGNESRVRDGPLAGTTLHELVATWGRGLLGDAPLVDGRFPLLVKFLDAREDVSVQVHPKPGTGTYLPKPGTGALPRQLGARKMGTGTSPQRLGASPQFPAVKHEAWYVVHAEPGAKLYIGLKPGVGPEDVRRAADTPAIVDLLQTWNATPGECFYLPSGTPHALGAGVVVAEVQTPSDVTYRLYDWGRVGLDGRPRELHIEQALANIRYDVTPEIIRSAGPPCPASVTARALARPSVVGDASSAEAHRNTADPSAALRAGTAVAHTRLIACDRFTIDRVDLPAGASLDLPRGRMAILVILSGAGQLLAGDRRCRFGTGDVVLVPAGCARVISEVASPCTYLAAGIPSR